MKTLSQDQFKRSLNVSTNLFGVDETDYYVRKYGISLESECSIDTRIPIHIETEFFERSAKRIGDPVFGLTWVDFSCKFADSGVIERGKVCIDVYDTVIQGCRLLPYVSESILYKLVPYDSHHSKLIAHLDESCIYHQVDAALLLWITITRDEYSQRTIEPNRRDPDFVEVHLSHSCPVGYRSKYADAYQTDLKFNQELSGIVISNQFLNSRLRVELDSIKRAVQMEIALSDIKHGKRNLADAIYRSLLAMAPYSMPTREEIANHFNMSLRTLQRKLAESNTNFKEIADKTRRDKAFELMNRDVYSVSEITHLLGYSDLSAFNKAYNRWILSNS
ncbi:helix-turn-helix transcriptional regulator [Microbulbifer sp. GL-2]|uniref:helix-turn-helix transcriptional regulator n=1 Tax=Microbulbifer sp. GL-2 TaxID=2591606 RepID=UPI001161D3EE|nr:helix-turn-helix transcriptional regulator [Microbulbifer sp. GL-2]BBM00180.1 hypothetical protein GL2_02540 [Microbulbifer sp. GL-2]